MDEADRQRILDDEHLRLLRIGYFVMGGIAVFVALMGLLYFAMGLIFTAVISAAPSVPGQVPPALMAWIFVGMGAFVILAGAAYAVLAFLTAKALRLRRSRGLCLVTAALTTLHLPFGTVLGIMTFSVLDRATVRALFAPHAVTAAGGA
jgi:hypothetical protein